MANTPAIGVRIDPTVIDTVAERWGLGHMTPAALLRFAVLLAAGRKPEDARRDAYVRTGPRPQIGAGAGKRSA